MKQVCVNCRNCSTARLTTASALLPTLVTAMPEPRSISELPSTSCTTPPPGAGAKARQRDRDPARHALVAPREQLPRLGPGDLGHQPAFLRQRRSADGAR